MRFEIRGGGFFMILVGILGLSTAVFVFGLLAGYDVGRQSVSATEQVATTYSIPSAPLVSAASAPAPPSTTAPPEVAATEKPPEADSGDSEAKPIKAPAAEGEMGGGAGVANDDEAPPPDEGVAPSEGSRESKRTASAEANNPDATDDTDNAASDDEAPPPKRHAFNIQIQAAMDLSGANQMIRRLQKIGYPAHLVATPIRRSDLV